jgi:lysophospholipase L1-like esterase
MDGWVTTWGAALQPPDQADDPPLSGATLRQTIRVSAGGRAARLILSNEYGERALDLGAVAVARPAGGRAGVPDIEPGSGVLLTFAGSVAASIPPGQRLASDEFAYVVPPGTDLTVTLSVRSAPAMLTTHPGSRTTSYVAVDPRGRREGHSEDHPEGQADDQPDGRRAGPAVLGRPSGPVPAESVLAAELPGAIPVVHWYLLAALEVRAVRSGDRGPAAIVCLGDSLTDGRGSTTDGNDRWLDVLAGRLHAAGWLDRAVVNQGVGGGRVLRDGLGIAALGRFDRDVVAPAGVRWLIVLAGINDIGQADATDAAQQRLGDELIAGYAEMVDRAHAHGIAVYGATLTPFAGHGYDDPGGWRERTRQRVNAWIRASGRFDAVVDADRVVRDPHDHRRLRRAYDDGDGLHLNPAGYRALADAVPLALFT